MTIENLTERENQLILNSTEMFKVRGQNYLSSMESVLVEENRIIYEEYVLLFFSEPGQFEALKRAIFLQWYAASEPPYLSLLYDLKPDFQRLILEKLQEQIQNKSLDREFENMLSYYYFITDWYYDGFSDLSILIEYLKRVSKNHKSLENLRKSDFSNRGQMGVFWRSVLEYK